MVPLRSDKVQKKVPMASNTRDDKVRRINFQHHDSMVNLNFKVNEGCFGRLDFGGKQAGKDQSGELDETNTVVRIGSVYNMPVG